MPIDFAEAAELVLQQPLADWVRERRTDPAHGYRSVRGHVEAGLSWPSIAVLLERETNGLVGVDPETLRKRYGTEDAAS